MPRTFQVEGSCSTWRGNYAWSELQLAAPTLRDRFLTHSLMTRDFPNDMAGAVGRFER
jgi:hypothetical protein